MTKYNYRHEHRQPVSMEAVILAAGRGKRLRPITDHVPKPLIKVGQNRLIEHHIWGLKQNGFKRLVINLAHLGDQIKAVLGAGTRFGMEIVYSREPEGALETGGGIRQALDYIHSDVFIVINSDIYTDYEFKKIRLGKDQNAHLIMVDNPIHNPTGDFVLHGAKIGLIKRPSFHSMTFSGVGYYRRCMFESHPKGRYPLLSLLEQQIRNQRVSGEPYHGLWIDVGTEERLEAARQVAR